MARPVCNIHPHSSEQTARRCYEQTMEKRLDRRYLLLGYYPTIPRYGQVRHDPPVEQAVGAVTLTVFYSAVPK